MLPADYAKKFDDNKLPLDLIDPDAIEGLATILQHGADKYGRHNWRIGLPFSRVVSALMRHLFAFMRGEDVDPESGLLHVDHILCNAMFLSNFVRNRKDLDDRYKPSPALTEDFKRRFLVHD
jgi:hypothetical protein